jgi:drug/metabolite transporter (DMT)-like permease
MVAALCVPAALLFDGVPTLPTSTAAWVSFAYLAVPSTVVAFALQIAGQRHTAPATASVIMLLEAPIGAVAATLWFAEDMSAGQALAALVLVAGVGLSIAAELRRRHA